MITVSGIYYEIHRQGEGIPLVLLHGNGEDSSIFAGAISRFPNRTIVLVDTRGHGLSRPEPRPVSFYQLADDLSEVLDDAGIPLVDIIGFSDGGNLAFHFARQYPDRLHRAVTLGANIHPSGMTTLARLSVAITYYALSALSFVPSLRRRAWFYRLMHREPALKPLDLTGIDAPFFVMAGEKDMIKRAHTKLIADSIPSSKHYIHSKGSHFFFFDYPPEVIAMIDAFFCD